MVEMMGRTFLPCLGEPGYRWNGGERLRRALLLRLGEPGYCLHGGDDGQNPVTWSWRAWLSLEWGRDCVELHYCDQRVLNSPEKSHFGGKMPMSLFFLIFLSK